MMTLNHLLHARKRGAAPSAAVMPWATLASSTTLGRQAGIVDVTGAPLATTSLSFDQLAGTVRQSLGDDFFGRPVAVGPADRYFSHGELPTPGSACVVTVASEAGDVVDGALVSFDERRRLWEGRPFKCLFGQAQGRSGLGSSSYSASVGNLITTCLLAGNPDRTCR